MSLLLFNLFKELVRLPFLGKMPVPGSNLLLTDPFLNLENLFRREASFWFIKKSFKQKSLFNILYSFFKLLLFIFPSFFLTLIVFVLVLFYSHVQNSIMIRIYQLLSFCVPWDFSYHCDKKFNSSKLVWLFQPFSILMKLLNYIWIYLKHLQNENLTKQI